MPSTTLEIYRDTVAKQIKSMMYRRWKEGSIAGWVDTPCGLQDAIVEGKPSLKDYLNSKEFVAAHKEGVPTLASARRFFGEV